MMKQIFFLLSIFAVLSGIALAQSNDEYKKTEFFVGYSNGQIDDGTNLAFHGINVSGVYNLTRYIGIKGDFSATRGGRRVNFGTNTASFSFREKITLFNILGGIQFKDNANSGRFKPFAHALVGAGHIRARTSDFQCTPAGSCGAAGLPGSGPGRDLAFAFGGGLDIRIKNRIQFRLIQVDYNPVKLTTATQNNVRLATGIVF